MTLHRVEALRPYFGVRGDVVLGADRTCGLRLGRIPSDGRPSGTVVDRWTNARNAAGTNLAVFRGADVEDGTNPQRRGEEVEMLFVLSLMMGAQAGEVPQVHRAWMADCTAGLEEASASGVLKGDLPDALGLQEQAVLAVNGVSVLDGWDAAREASRGSHRCELTLALREPVVFDLVGDPSGEPPPEEVPPKLELVLRPDAEQLLRPFAERAFGVRALLHRRADGEYDGMRLSGILRRHPFIDAGFQPCDVVHSVNGQGLTSYRAGVDAHQAVMQVAPSSLTFVVTRRGERVEVVVPLGE